MDADLDLLLTAVYVTADDLLPEKPKNAKRSVTDAEASRSASPRRSWGYRLTGGSSRSRRSTCATCSRGSPGKPATTSVVGVWRTRWSG